MGIKIMALIAIVVFAGGLVVSGMWMNSSGASTHHVNRQMANSSGTIGGCC